MVATWGDPGQVEPPSGSFIGCFGRKPEPGWSGSGVLETTLSGERSILDANELDQRPTPRD